MGLASFSSYKREPEKDRDAGFLGNSLSSNRENQNTSRSSGSSIGSFQALGGYSGWRSPEQILYPSVNNPKPLLSPYTSLNPSPVRRVRGLATLSLYRPEYNKIM
ncbi:hypothetical protein [Kiloniella sp. EL199]|uniref:hypothetical protein n=1 Tax=Kiloniella sp. EL199 TaxID=2107581 RepID=UPI000EA11D25|nr:hypothetical protein [Kiloniella sp. EL199]